MSGRHPASCCASCCFCSAECGTRRHTQLLQLLQTVQPADLAVKCQGQLRPAATRFDLQCPLCLRDTTHRHRRPSGCCQRLLLQLRQGIILIRQIARMLGRIIRHLRWRHLRWRHLFWRHQQCFGGSTGKMTGTGGRLPRPCFLLPPLLCPALEAPCPLACDLA